MLSEKIFEREPLKEVVEKVTQMGRKYFRIDKMLREDSRDDFRKFYLNLQSYSIETQSAVIDEISRNPTGYNFSYLDHIVSVPHSFSQKIPERFGDQKSLKASQELVLKHLCEGYFKKSYSMN